jgi:hypothetical protein
MLFTEYYLNDLHINDLVVRNMRGKQIAYITVLPIAFASMHWITAQMYAHFCAPPGFYGYIVTFFNIANPVCSYMLQVMDMSKYFYTQSWIFIGITTLSACKHVYEKYTAHNEVGG